MRLHAQDMTAPDLATSNAARPPVVLLHGLFGRGRNLARLGRALGAGRRAVAFDLRSHGDSPHGTLALDAAAADVLETLDALGFGRAVLFGHSLGGKVAMRAALAAPELVSALLVGDIAPVAERHGNAAIADALAALPIERFATRADADRALAATIADPAVRGLLLQNLDTRPPMRWRVGLDPIRHSIDDIEGWAALPDPYARYGGPALFVRGERSDYLRPDHAAAIKGLFPRARFETVPDAGHWLHVEQPDAFNAICAGFLDGIDGGPGTMS